MTPEAREVLRRSDMTPCIASYDLPDTGRRNAVAFTKLLSCYGAPLVIGAYLFDLFRGQFRNAPAFGSPCSFLQSSRVGVQHLLALGHQFQVASSVIGLSAVLVIDGATLRNTANEMSKHKAMHQCLRGASVSTSGKANPEISRVAHVLGEFSVSSTPKAFAPSYPAVVADFVGLFVSTDWNPSWQHHDS